MQEQAKTLTDFQHHARFLFPEVNADHLQNHTTETYLGGYEQALQDFNITLPVADPLPYRPLPIAEEETDFNCANL